MRTRTTTLLASALVAASIGASACVPQYGGERYEVGLTSNYAYGSAPDEHGATQTLTLDLFSPQDGRTDRTAIVLVHSGGFTTGTRTEMEPLARALAERGYVVASISYRVREGKFFWFSNPSSEALQAITDARHDAQAAVRWLRRYSVPLGVDRESVAIAGYSAGAITSLGVAQGATDPGDSGHPGQSSQVCLGASISGFAMSEAFTESDAPVLFLHGAEDVFVPPELARLGAERASAAGKLAGHVEYPGLGHALYYQRIVHLADEIDTAVRNYC